jgi:hypothetical protein
VIRRFELVAAAALLFVACAREAPPPKQVQAPSPTVATHPEFLSPRAGDAWSETESYLIIWRAPGWDSVNVGVVMGGKDRGHLAFHRDARNDTLIWSIPKGWATGFGVARADSVRLRLENAADPRQFVDSALFTVGFFARI